MPGTPRRKQRQRTIDDAEHDAEAARLRAIGKTFPEIAAIQGCTKSTAFERVRRAIAAVPVEAVEELRAVENARLDAITAKLWDVLTAVHPLISYGQVMRGDDGRMLIDDGPVISAAGALVRVMERRARLNGLDAPTRHDVKVSEDDEGLEAEFRRLVTQLGARAAGAAGPHGAIEAGSVGGGGDAVPHLEA